MKRKQRFPSTAMQEVTEDRVRTSQMQDNIQSLTNAKHSSKESAVYSEPNHVSWQMSLSPTPR